ncbi:MAG: M14 family zinc carboxypeptidase [Thermoanaerobaculia bacterium]
MRSLCLAGLGRLAPLALALALAAHPAAAAESAGFAGDGPWQVKVYFAGPADLQLLGERFDHFARERATGAILVFAADRSDLDWLAERGLWVELDAERTRWIEDGARAAALTEAPLAGIPGFPCYRTVEETFAAAQAIVAAHPDLAAWVDVGDSWQKSVDSATGYDMNVLVLTNHAIPGPKPRFFVTSAIHAREYTTAESVTRFAEQLVAGYGSDADATWLLDWHEIHLLLLTNPDGRKKAEAGQLWRKNVDTNTCVIASQDGVDLNRNFAFQWACCGGSSSQGCNDTYRGPVAGSEPEVQAVTNYLRSQYADLRAADPDVPAADDVAGVYLDVHSFGEWVITPYTFRDPGEGSPNLDEYNRFAHRLAWYSGFEPLVGGPYVADGTTSDFGYGDLGVASIAFELGTAFFESCTSFENDVLPGTFAMLRYAARVARAPYRLPAGPDAIDLALAASPVAAGMPARLTARIDDTRTSTLGGLLPSQSIFSATAYVDTPPWAAGAQPRSLAPADGAFDTPSENAEVTLETGALAAGRHLVFVQGRDTDGDDGPVSAMFLDVTASTILFADDFETGGTDRWSATGT